MVLHLIMHVMVNEGMLTTLLKHELTKNHDGHHWEHHLVEEMTWTKYEPVSFE